MLTLKTDKECQYIVKNVLAACKDITKLTKAGYSFLYLSSGFIAHYNRSGFIAEFSQRSLRESILENQRFNQWQYHSKNPDASYYYQKKDIYNAICIQLEANV